MRCVYHPNTIASLSQNSICHLEVQMGNFIVEFLHIGAVKMLDKYSISLICVDVKYTIHSKEI